MLGIPIVLTFGGFDDWFKQQWVLGHTLRHQQNAFWDTQPFAHIIPTTFL